MLRSISRKDFDWAKRMRLAREVHEQVLVGASNIAREARNRVSRGKRVGLESSGGSPWFMRDIIFFVKIVTTQILAAKIAGQSQK